MGEMVSIKVLTALTRDYMLPEGAKVTWDEVDAEQVAQAEGMFNQYLKDGWMAFSDEPEGRRQIFKFDPKLKRIVLVPPLGGG